MMNGKILQSSFTKYMILDFIGEGSFGKVAKCLNLNSGEIVAVKILKNKCRGNVDNELYMSTLISLLNADLTNVVKFYENFQYLAYNCLVFEMLDKDLVNIVHQQCCTMYLNQIRPIAKQLLVALEALHYLGVTHGDIKPNNIVLINQEALPFKVKLIDFGLAFHSYPYLLGFQHQAVGYRAPEVSLGLPYSQAIDMWGLGCSLVFLYLGTHLFPSTCEYLMMKHMVMILGMPRDHHLQNGLFSRRFFCKEDYKSGTRWRLLTPDEYTAVNKKQVKEWPKDQCHVTSLDDLLHIYDEDNPAEMEDRMFFIDFLKRLLDLNGRKRISPTAALQHPFITMSHLSQDPDYLTIAQALVNTTSSRDPNKVQVPPFEQYYDSDLDEAQVH